MPLYRPAHLQLPSLVRLCCRRRLSSSSIVRQYPEIISD